MSQNLSSAAVVIGVLKVHRNSFYKYWLAPSETMPGSAIFENTKQKKKYKKKINGCVFD